MGVHCAGAHPNLGTYGGATTAWLQQQYAVCTQRETGLRVGLDQPVVAPGGGTQKDAPVCWLGFGLVLGAKGWVGKVENLGTCAELQPIFNTSHHTPKKRSLTHLQLA
jgi:hypothetical protein